MNRVTIREAKAHLSKLIQRARDGEEIIINQHGLPLVRLEAVQEGPPRRTFGGLKDLVLVMGDSFNDELEDFADYAPAAK